MVAVKTFVSSLEILHTMKELNDIDDQVNRFIKEKGITNVISVSDTCTTDDTGKTIGIIRVLTYEE